MKSLIAQMLGLVIVLSACSDAASEATAELKHQAVKADVERSITPSELPASILNYISKNYSGYVITSSEIDLDDKERVYAVGITRGEGELELNFDMNGTFLDKHEDEEENGEFELVSDESGGIELEIPLEQLPTRIIDAISASFPQSTPLEADRILYEDGSVSFDVEIRTLEGQILELMFDAQGTSLGIEQDADDLGFEVEDEEGEADGEGVEDQD